MKSLKIVKGRSDAVNRRTDNTIAKKWKKVANKIEQHEHHLKGLDTKKVIRIRKSKHRQHNDQKKKDKRTNNNLQNIHIKLKIE